MLELLAILILFFLFLPLWLVLATWIIPLIGCLFVALVVGLVTGAITQSAGFGLCFGLCAIPIAYTWISDRI